MLKWLGNLVDSNEKEIKRLQPLVDRINELETEFQKLSDAELRAKTDEFKARIAEATAEIKKELAEAQKEIEETRQCLPAVLEEFEKKEKESRCKQLEEDIAQIQKEQWEIEEDALEELLPEAFAAVREAARRRIGQRHYDVQLMGGIVLHQGKIAEMKTGEGQTLVATLPLYLNSLTGRGCHLVTVNDYLSKIGHQWMGPVYHALGVSVTSIQHEASFLYDPAHQSENTFWPALRPISRREAYQADITYGTNNEFGFDYLRDNMVVDLAQCAQRELNYAIVDEVDNILIDEARTPLIISGQRQESLQEYQVFARIAAGLRPETDYKMSEKGRSVDEIYESGYDNAEKILKREGFLKSGNLYDNAALVHHLRNAITAKESYLKDQQYVVKDGQVIIVDEFTGRLMPGRRYSEGLHQAIEAKERVKVQQESLTYATITFQNYFRMYNKLSGMTGTALTEAEEFHKIYKLEVVVIPTNEPMIRQDYSDRIYKDQQFKFKAVVNEVGELHKKGQPVLIGTVSIEKSEVLSELMTRKGIPHQVLNAKQHEKEAGIIAQAGRLGAVTVATNMAGRGVDIVLGGNPTGRDEKEWRQEHDKVVGLGGLFVIGTERHEARRIDNQLRGRSGRQGDPGESRFYVSLEDDIMKRFGGDRVKWLMDKVGMDEDTPIENKLINRTIEGAQTRVEGYHFDIRKQLVEYDDVVNQQRELIYKERRKILSGADLKANILSMVKEEMNRLMAAHAGDQYGEGRDTRGLLADAATIMPVPKELNAEAIASLKPEEIEEKLAAQAEALYEQREKEIGPESMRMVERLVMLRTLDNRWIDHLTEMDHQRLQAGWAGLQQQKAVDVYKNLGAEQWQLLTDDIRHDVASTIFHVNIVRQEAAKPAPTPMAKVAAGAGRTNQHQQPQKVSGKKVGRNDPCPCGSGKKYKNCHGR
ncbi:MAG: preprotein translocase subunit SecA [Chloroflexi bacterium]|nr:preprotein translocase subunit SecA [Chloroflexota bacterium]